MSESPQVNAPNFTDMLFQGFGMAWDSLMRACADNPWLAVMLIGLPLAGLWASATPRRRRSRR